MANFLTKGGVFDSGGSGGNNFSRLTDALQHPLFAMASNFFSGIQGRKDLEAFQEKLDLDLNDPQKALSAGIGQSTNQIVQQGLAGANSPFFNPAAIGHTFNQEGKDINRSFDALRGQTQGALAARGLGGSTIGTSQSALQNRQRQDALGGLASRKFAAQQAGVTSRLGFMNDFGNLGIGGAQAASSILDRQTFLPPAQRPLLNF